MRDYAYVGGTIDPTSKEPIILEFECADGILRDNAHLSLTITTSLSGLDLNILSELRSFYRAAIHGVSGDTPEALKEISDVRFIMVRPSSLGPYSQLYWQGERSAN